MFAFSTGVYKTAQQAVKLFDLLVWVLLGVTIAVIIAALAISPRRLRTLIQLGIGVVVVVVIGRIAINQLQEAIVEQASGSGGTIIRSVVDTVFGSLQNTITWLLVGGAIIAVLAYFATTPKWLSRATHSVSAWGRRAWHAAAEQTTREDNPTVDWIRAHLDALRIGIGAVAVAILLFGSPGWGWALAIIVVAGALIGGLMWVGRQTPTGEGKAVS